MPAPVYQRRTHAPTAVLPKLPATSDEALPGSVIHAQMVRIERATAHAHDLTRRARALTVRRDEFAGIVLGRHAAMTLDEAMRVAAAREIVAAVDAALPDATHASTQQQQVLTGLQNELSHLWERYEAVRRWLTGLDVREEQRPASEDHARAAVFELVGVRLS